MDSKRKKKIDEARFVAKELKDIGENTKADMVLRLVRAHIHLAETTRRLWDDNMALRKELEE